MRSPLLVEYELTTAQAAGYLQLSTGHLYNLIWRGQAPPHLRYGGQLRFRRSDLDAWIDQRCGGEEQTNAS